MITPKIILTLHITNPNLMDCIYLKHKPPSISPTILHANYLPSPSMDHSYVSYSVQVPRPLVRMLHIVDIIGYGISAILYRVGLYPSFQSFPSPWDDQLTSLNAAECVTTSPTSPSLLKSRLPVVEYRRWSCATRPEETCAVCLRAIHQDDEVRELGNCCHAFHRSCIDRWIDMGKVTCPMCRLEMAPSKGRGGLGLFLSFVKKLR